MRQWTRGLLWVGVPQYSFENTRGEFVSPFGRIALTGRNASEGMDTQFNNPDTSQYTEVDGLGMHTIAVDQKSGSITVSVQDGSATCTQLRAVINTQKTTGASFIGSVTLSDITGTSILITMTNARLANQPGVTFGTEAGNSSFVFRGSLTILQGPPVNIPFGVTPAPPPLG